MPVGMVGHVPRGVASEKLRGWVQGLLQLYERRDPNARWPWLALPSVSLLPTVFWCIRHVMGLRHCVRSCTGPLERAIFQRERGNNMYSTGACEHARAQRRSTATRSRSGNQAPKESKRERKARTLGATSRVVRSSRSRARLCVALGGAASAPHGWAPSWRA